MKDAINTFVTDTYDYILSELLVSDDIAPWLQKIIAQKGVDGALDWTRQVTAPYTPQSYYDEIQGIADASGIDYDLLFRVNVFPELTKA